MRKVRNNWHLHIEYSDTKRVIKYCTTKEKMLSHVIHIIAYAFQRNSAFKKLTLWREK